MNLELAAFILGIIGTILGVTNFFRSIFDERVRLCVIPSLGFMRDDGGMLLDTKANRIKEMTEAWGIPTISIEIRNLSKFPVTVTEIGLCDKDIEASRSPFRLPKLMGVVEGARLPRRVETHDVLSVSSTENHGIGYKFTTHTRAYAKTASGTVHFGQSEALKGWARVRQRDS